MNLKIRIMGSKTISKTETTADIERIFYKGNMINSKDSSVKICFRQENTSGIIELSMEEIEEINNLIKEEKNIHKDKLEEAEQIM